MSTALSPACPRARGRGAGSYLLGPCLAMRGPDRTRNFPRLVLVADHPGLAVGWRVIPDDAEAFERDVTLSSLSAPRTVGRTTTSPPMSPVLALWSEQVRAGRPRPSSGSSRRRTRGCATPPAPRWA